MSIQIYAEDIHNILNYHNVAKLCKFDAHGAVVSNTTTVGAPAVEIKMATFIGAERARMFWFKEMKFGTQLER
jgi:hypothetical protein